MKEPEGAAKRALRMAALTAGVTGSYVGYLAQRAFLNPATRSRKLKAVHTNAAKRMTAELGALRGPAMKLGQTLSLQAGLLPEEMLNELATLQMQAPGMHPTLARARFKAALGKEPEEVFQNFMAEPFAAASLGQVHHAITRHGEPVAVKLQYPGIRAAVANDFRWFRAVSKGAQLTRHLPEPTLAELEAQILAETDYRLEVDNLERMRKALAPLEWVTVPRVYRRLSGAGVITTHVSGRPRSRKRCRSLAARSVWWPGYASCAVRSTRSATEIGRSTLTSMRLWNPPSYRLNAIHGTSETVSYVTDSSAGIAASSCARGPSTSLSRSSATRSLLRGTALSASHAMYRSRTSPVPGRAASSRAWTCSNTLVSVRVGRRPRHRSTSSAQAGTISPSVSGAGGCPPTAGGST